MRSMTAWGLSGRLPPSPRIREVTRSVLTAHAPPERQVIDWIAVGGALPFEVVVTFSDATTVAGLEASGEVIVESDLVKLGPALNAASPRLARGRPVTTKPPSTSPEPRQAPHPQQGGPGEGAGGLDD